MGWENPESNNKTIAISKRVKHFLKDSRLISLLAGYLVAMYSSYGEALSSNEVVAHREEVRIGDDDEPCRPQQTDGSTHGSDEEHWSRRTDFSCISRLARGGGKEGERGKAVFLMLWRSTASNNSMDPLSVETVCMYCCNTQGSMLSYYSPSATTIASHVRLGKLSEN